nr:hypothetical protein CFP56_01365 [Quercus suber]
MTSTTPPGPGSEPSSSPAKDSKHDWPSNWPDDGTVFLTDQTYSDAVTEELKIALSRTTGEFSTYPRVAPATLAGPCPVEIRLIVNEKHPAVGQRGLFASSKLEPDMFLCLYLGHVHTNSLSDTDPRSDYDLSLDRELGLSVDAARSGNESRCANDYRGIAERPNAEFRDCLVKVPCSKRKSGSKWERRVGIFVLSAGKAGKRKAGILVGEEVLVSYGKGYDQHYLRTSSTGANLHRFWESRQLMGKFRKDFEMLSIATAALNA